MNKRLQATLLIIAIVLGLFLGYQQIVPPKAPKDVDETPITLSEASGGPDFQLMLTLTLIAGMIQFAYRKKDIQ